jgi:hypothetical protein
MSAPLDTDVHREPFASFLATILKAERAEPELIAQAFAVHLAAVDPAKLPKAAQPVWNKLVTRLLKTPADKVPISPRGHRGHRLVAHGPHRRVDRGRARH